MSDIVAVSTQEHATLAEATELLNSELPDKRFVDTCYLDWLYHQNPAGPAIYGFRRGDDGALEGHYALIGQEYMTPDGPIPWMFSLNAVSRTGAQRRGHFVSLTQELFARAGDAGRIGAFGVTNDNSTRAVKRTEFRYLGPMPVIVRPIGSSKALGSTNWRHRPVTPGWLHSDEFAAAMTGLDTPSIVGLKNNWTVPYLRWRLSSPHSARYMVHLHDEVVAISTTHAAPGGVPVAVLLKVLPRTPNPAKPLPGAAIMSAVARAQRAPAALYAGFNHNVELTGWQPPRKYLPSPLNLNYVPFRAPGAASALPVAAARCETFEFLDCDAY